jgi:hypothetical protein
LVLSNTLQEVIPEQRTRLRDLSPLLGILHSPEMLVAFDMPHSFQRDALEHMIPFQLMRGVHLVDADWHDLAVILDGPDCAGQALQLSEVLGRNLDLLVLVLSLGLTLLVFLFVALGGVSVRLPLAFAFHIDDYLGGVAAEQGFDCDQRVCVEGVQGWHLSEEEVWPAPEEGLVGELVAALVADRHGHVVVAGNAFHLAPEAEILVLGLGPQLEQGEFQFELLLGGQAQTEQLQETLLVLKMLEIHIKSLDPVLL